MVKTCYVLHPDNGLCMMIIEGKPGMRITEYGRITQEEIDGMNAAAGVTKAEVSAMIVGAEHGWNDPGADPSKYDENGKFKGKHGLFLSIIPTDYGTKNEVEISTTANSTIEELITHGIKVLLNVAMKNGIDPVQLALISSTFKIRNVKTEHGHYKK